MTVTDIVGLHLPWAKMVRFCTASRICLCLLIGFSTGIAQISAVSLNLSNSFDKDANHNSNYRQRYQLMVMGTLLNENIGDFVLATSFTDQRALQTSTAKTLAIPTLWNYNFRGNILKTSRFPLKFSLIRSRREPNTTVESITQEQFENNDFISIHGSLPGNGVLPKISYSSNFSQIADQDAVIQSGTQYSLAISNQ